MTASLYLPAAEVEQLLARRCTAIEQLTLSGLIQQHTAVRLEAGKRP